MEQEIIEAYKIKKYGKCINLLERDINQIFFNKVKVIKPDYKYITINELYEIGSKVLDKKDKIALEIYFRIIHDTEIDKITKIKNLIDLRSNIKRQI